MSPARNGAGPAIEVRASPLHGLGVFARQRIPKGMRIIEYLGERVSHAEADRRYEDKDSSDAHTFLFIVDERTVIDAGVGGNEARFINHACDPNCESVIENRRVFIEAVSEYLTDFQSSGAQLIGAERRFRLEIDRAVVNGSIDRVERAADGGVVIVDLKTGSPVTSQARIDEHPQLGAYQLAYAEGLLDEALSGAGEHHAGGAKLLFVKSGKGGRLYREGEQAALDAEGLEAVRERIRQAAAGMAAAEFEGLVELSGWGLGDQSGLRLQRVKAVSSD